MTTRVFKLEGLGCASCAAKMEKEIGKQDGVISVRLDFASAKVIFEAADNEKADQIAQKLPGIVNSIESGVSIIDVNKNDHHSGYIQKADKGTVAIFAAGIVLFLLAIFLDLNDMYSFILFFTSWILIGGKVILTALKNMFRGKVFDENFLMFIATVGAFAIGEYPEATAVMLFFRVGEFFQDMAVNRSRRSISSLMDIRPDYANLKEGNAERKVSPEEIEVGQIILVKPGEKVPLDGTVIEGNSLVDTSSLTGEFVPRRVETGAGILAGFINKNGLLVVQVTNKFEDSAVARILDMVENAAGKKAPTEKFISRFAQYYTPAVVLGAVLLAVIPPLVFQGAVFSEWLNRALVFLVVSCPCALVISIPLSFFGGIGGASRQGILIKGSNYLEALNSVQTVVFDKTGTLTEGVFKVTNIAPEGVTEDELIKYAALAEKYSNHPVAASILQRHGQELHDYEITEYHEVAGYGVKAKHAGKQLIAGSARFLEKENILPGREMEKEGTAVYVAVDGKYIGSISISDKIRKGVPEAIQGLRKVGVQKIIMLTGDNRKVGESVGRELGFDAVYSELLPDQKVHILEKLVEEKNAKTKICFVGDGINDAPVLARADVGIAMGGLGSDAAIEAADIVLMTDQPSGIVRAFLTARKTRNIVWQNIIFALGIKGVVLLLGAMGIATMWAAVFADVGVAVLAILNAMRVLRLNPKLSF